MGCIITPDEKLWPFGIVPFRIRVTDFPAGSEARKIVDSAIGSWNKNTAVKFVPRTNENDFIEFQRSDSKACSSPAGRQGGCQIVHCTTNLLLFPGFTVDQITTAIRRSLIHEMGHAVGLWHEHSREDRDQYVVYSPENVIDGQAHNFDKHVNDGDDVGNYDVDSVMHYDRKQHSKNGENTLTFRSPTNVNVGKYPGLSQGDIATIRFIYSIWEPGNLLFYRDRNRDGTGDVSNPSLIGRGSWNNYLSVFSGSNGIIYAIDTNGRLIFYRDHKRNGIGEIGNDRTIGESGWDQFRSVFSGGDGDIYAITTDGNLLFYKDRTQNGTGDVANPGLIGRGGWDQFVSVFPGGNGILYAISQDGDLLFYRDQHRNGTGEVTDPAVIGHGGWDQFQSVFSDGSGVLYAISPDGNLFFYRDRNRNGTGEVFDPRLIGQGGWQQFKFVFAGGDGAIYAILP